MTQLVFVDANVLFSRTRRDWLFLLRRETGGSLFRLCTSVEVLHEVGARLRNANPAADSSLIGQFHERVDRFLDHMVAGYPGGPVEGIEDHDDWHVHHAAMHCRADALLTEGQGFLSAETGYEVYDCDEFFQEVAWLAPNATREVTRFQAAYWAARAGSQLPDALRAAGCPRFAEVVLGHLRGLARGT
ncbi:PIN domain-containing protein [Rothia sp. AR01]|uniref:PIN domain-containing protein n=1 Tax=Rothia santali TaxID=2949643 RepID=A0A9X2HCK6_9MICC|nr:PIN domain-containing protein [Rothia santali]MCP3425645.1 PIN domain-containing protein [Rothia santali]